MYSLAVMAIAPNETEPNMSTSPDLSAPLAHRIPDACRRLGISRTSIYELIKTGEIRPFRIGTRTLIPEAELQKVITARMEATP